MIVAFRTDSSPDASAGGVAADGGAPTLTCVDCGSTGAVSDREAAIANGDLDGIRRDVKCHTCADASDRRVDVTT